MLFVAGQAVANTTAAPIAELSTGISVRAAGVTIALVLIGALTITFLTSQRLKGSSLFHRLFIVVAVTAGFFSAISSAIGFSLITSQESADFFRNSVLPPAFGVFVFFLAVAIWVGGAELVRQRDWFRDAGPGPVGDFLFFIERAMKLFVVIPVFALILFLVSTWTTVVGIGGVDSVRHTYNQEIDRLRAECAGITAYRQKDFLFLEDLRLSVADVTRAARNEREGGAQTGSAGEGAVSDYFAGLADWYRELERTVAAMIEAPDPSGVDLYDAGICAAKTGALKKLLSRNAHENYDLWAREFETAYNDFASALNRWRHDRRIEILLGQQLTTFARSNPKPLAARLSSAQRDAIDRYAAEVEDALGGLIRKQKRTKPPVPVKSAAELSPARGLDIFRDLLAPPDPIIAPERVSRTAAIVAAENVPGLSTITPRDAVLKNANIFSDLWVLAISWDYAAYILLFAYLFFPTAERAAGYKDDR